MLNMMDANEILADWHPMKEAYKNLEYNSYNAGPGAGLPAILHATHEEVPVKKNNEKAPPKPYLTIRNLPNRLGLSGLESLCCRHGKVTAIRYNDRLKRYFVNFATVCDMEEAYKHLSENTFGFQVDVGIPRQESMQNLQNEDHNNNNEIAAAPAPVANKEPELERRQLPLSQKLQPRPFIKPEPVIDVLNLKKTDHLLKRNDPLNFHLFAEDAFTLDHAGLALDPKQYSLTRKYSHYAGRAYLELSEVEKKRLQQNLEDKKNNCEFVQKSGEELFEDMQKGNCDICEFPCIAKCATYDVFVCSTACQKRIGKLQDEALLPQAALPANDSTVCIMSIKKSNVLFLREKSIANDEKFSKIIAEVDKKSLKLPKLKHAPVIGKIVVAKFAKFYQRAIVLNAQNMQAICIMFLDYGNMLYTPISELYAAPADFLQFPLMVRPFILKGVPEFYMNQHLRAFMYACLEKRAFKLRYDKVEDFDEQLQTYTAELVEVSTNANLNQFIYRLCNPLPPSVNLQREILTENDMPYLPLTTGKNVELFIMDYSWLKCGYVYCSMKPYVLEIQQFQKDIEAYIASAKDTDAYTPRQRELCLAKYSVDDKWYRGIGMESVGDGFPSIQFLDYGNATAVSYFNIRRYPDQFQFPICTHLCKIEGLPTQCPDKLVKRLEQVLQQHNPIICDQVHQEDGEFIIRMTDIINQLQKEHGPLSDPDSSID